MQVLLNQPPLLAAAKVAMPLTATLPQLPPQTRVVRYDSEAEARPLLSLFERIAKEQNWKPGKQLRAYPDSAVYFGLEVDGVLAGGLQLVRGNSHEGLPCLTVWPELDLQGRSDVADIALLALHPKIRGRQELFWLLCIEMWRYCRDHGVDSLYVEVTPLNLKLYRRLGWPLQIAGPLRKHWGEPCYPCSMTTSAIAQEITTRSLHSLRYRQILQLMHREVEPQ